MLSYRHLMGFDRFFRSGFAYNTVVLDVNLLTKFSFLLNRGEIFCLKSDKSCFSITLLVGQSL